MRGRAREAISDGAAFGVWAAVLLVALVPLAFDPGGYFIFLPIKWALLLAAAFGGLAALVRRHSLPRHAAWWWWAVLLTLIGAAAIFGVAPLTGLIGAAGRNLGLIAWLAFAAAFALGVVAGESPEGVERVAVAAVVASVPISVYALVQAAGIDPLSWHEGLDLTRARSTLGNASFLGAYLVLITPVAAGLAADSGRLPRTRLLFAGALVLGLGALLSTQTRAAWLGAAAAGLLIVAARRRLLATPARRVGIAIAAAGIATALLLTPLGERARSIADPTRGTARGRLVTWSLTAKLIAERPLLGWGPDSFAITFPRVIDARYEREVGRERIPDRAHNAFLDMAAAAGIGGTVAYAGLLVSVVLACIRGLKGAPVTAGMSAGIAGYLVQQQFSFPVADLDAVFWVIAGLLVAVAGKKRGAFALPRLLAPALALIAIILAVWAARDVAADRHLRLALEAEAAGRPEGALDHIDRAIALAPERGQYLQASARMRRRIGEAGGPPELFQGALEDLDRAKRLTPSPEFDLDRAGVLLAMAESTGDAGLAKRAESAYRSVLDTDPNSARALLKLGVALALQGRTSDAERAWLTAASLSPRSVGPRLNLGILYERAGDERRAIGQYLAVLKIDPDNAEARAALSRLGA